MSNHPQQDLSKKRHSSSKDRLKTKDVITPEHLYKLKSGDHSVFETIFLSYYDHLQHFLQVLTRSQEDSEELTQEVFVYIWSNRDKIDPSRNFKGYLYTIARNSAMRWFRDKRSHQIEAWEEIDDTQSNGGSASDEIIIAKETELLIKMVVAGMPRQRKKIYEMSRVEGLRNDEIADMLNISKNAVEKQITFALKDIRDVLALFILFMLP